MKRYGHVAFQPYTVHPQVDGPFYLADEVDAEIASLREELASALANVHANSESFMKAVNKSEEYRARAEKAERERAYLIEWKRSIEANPSSNAVIWRRTADNAVTKMKAARSGE